MRIERIVVGTDFGAASVAAARWATETLAPEADIILVHVLAGPPGPRNVDDATPESAEAGSTARRIAASRLGALARQLPDGRVRTLIVEGKPHVVLAELADDTGADLLVIGPHGEHPRPWQRLGTTADRLVRIARVPVLVAIGEPVGAPRKLLLCTEAAADARVTTAVLKWATHLASSFDAEVTTLDVGEPAHAALPVAGAAEESAAGIAAAPTAAVEAADAFAEAVAHAQPDLVVVGRCGSLETPEAVGTTIAGVLERASCPVLVVAEPTDAASEDW